MNYKRGNYGEILESSVNARTLKSICKLVDGAANAQKVDEHGNWEFGAVFDGKGRGSALNWDIYGIGRDVHNRRMLVVIQIRQWEKTRKNGFPNVRKSYFLLGRNEDDSVFAHPVESRVIHHAIKKNTDVIMAVQNWIFGADYQKCLRHGDVVLVPLTRQPNAPILDTNSMEIAPEDGTASHQLTAETIAQNGNLYALNPHLHHAPLTHPDVEATGWHKVIVGKRANFYSFAAPTID